MRNWEVISCYPGSYLLRSWFWKWPIVDNAVRGTRRRHKGVAPYARLCLVGRRIGPVSTRVNLFNRRWPPGSLRRGLERTGRGGNEETAESSRNHASLYTRGVLLESVKAVASAAGASSATLLAASTPSRLARRIVLQASGQNPGHRRAQWICVGGSQRSRGCVFHE
jgi:hypothetical protein